MRARTRTLRMLRLGAGLALIGVLIAVVDPRELLDVLGGLSLSMVALLFAISGAMIGVSAWKWKSFLDTPDIRLSFGRLFQLYLVGYFVNSFAPSFIGGDALRSWYVGKRVGQHAAAAATILERFTGLLAMVGLAAGCVWVVDRVPMEIRLAVVAIAVATLAGAATVMSRTLTAWCRRLIGSRYYLEKVFAHIARIQEAIRVLGEDRRRLGSAMALSLVFHTLTVLNTAVAGYAVGWSDPSLVDLFVVLPLILLLGAIPIAPSGLGIQEGAFYFFLQLLGASPAEALGVGIVLRAKGFALAIIGGVVWFFLHPTVPSEAAPARPKKRGEQDEREQDEREQN